ncbi:TetR/AcrR family transcriptional regulator [Pukyongiella litopenaei]|nr:TetR/AcrR family transcriptional regulator [Pukyongiella litopenaei]
MKTDLNRRRTPSQKRARDTIESILAATGDLLDEVGFENLSTNLICKKAGLTPPALYRYFPNKHAIMSELGQRLMAQQNAMMRGIFDGFSADDDLVAVIRHAMEAQLILTENTPGGHWITKALYASPALCAVRTRSHEMATDDLMATVALAFPGLPEDALRKTLRLTVEIGYSVIEFLLDVPETDRDSHLSETAELLAFSLARHQA